MDLYCNSCLTERQRQRCCITFCCHILCEITCGLQSRLCLLWIQSCIHREANVKIFNWTAVWPTSLAKLLRHSLSMSEQPMFNSSSTQKQPLTRRQVQFVEYFEFFSEVTMVHPTWKEKKKVKKNNTLMIKNHPLLTGSNQNEFPYNDC